MSVGVHNHKRHTISTNKGHIVLKRRRNRKLITRTPTRSTIITRILSPLRPRKRTHTLLAPTTLNKNRRLKTSTSLRTTLQRTIITQRHSLHTHSRNTITTRLNIRRIRPKQTSRVTRRNVLKPIRRHLQNTHLRSTPLKRRSRLINRNRHLNLIINSVSRHITRLTIRKFRLNTRFPLRIQISSNRQLIRRSHIRILTRRTTTGTSLLLNINNRPTNTTIRHIHRPSRNNSLNRTNNSPNNKRTPILRQRNRIITRQRNIMSSQRLRRLHSITHHNKRHNRITITGRRTPLQKRRRPQSSIRRHHLSTTQQTRRHVNTTILPNRHRQLRHRVITTTQHKRVTINRNIGHSPYRHTPPVPLTRETPTTPYSHPPQASERKPNPTEQSTPPLQTNSTHPQSTQPDNQNHTANTKASQPQ